MHASHVIIGFCIYKRPGFYGAAVQKMRKFAMENDLVSVVITTHNRNELLEKAILSVKNQTYGNIELVVIDDASDDGHKKKNELLAKDAIYRYIPREESKGGNYARNLGIELSSGSLIAFLDDDDVWDCTKIEKQVVRHKESHYEVIGCGHNLITVKNGKELFRTTDIRRGNDGKDFSEIVFRRPPYFTSELMITRNALIGVGKFDESLKSWQEYDLLIRLSEKYIFGCVEEALVDYYRDLSDPNRLTNKLDIYLESFPIIDNKYSERIQLLSPQFEMAWRMQYLRECANRSFNRNERRRYLKQIFRLEKNVKNLFFYLISIDFNSRFYVFIRGLKLKNIRKKDAF